jgi:transglutaminase-like putative cysteine protease
MRYRVSHTTTYEYEDLVSIGHNEVRLEPRPTATQACRATELAIEPAPVLRATGRDYFGNPTSFFTLQEPHHRMVLVATSELEIEASVPQEPDALAWDAVREGLRSDVSVEGLGAREMTFESPLVPASAEFAAYARASFPPGRPIYEAVRELTRRVHTDFKYRPGATSVTTPVVDVLERRHGVCQDFAHLEIACLRALGLPARYVSGYLRTRPVPGREKLVGADASHAWLSVWCGEAGWIDVDPTNDLVVSDQHVTLAWGRDYGDVAPIKGVVLGGGGHSVAVAVEVTVLD